MDELITISFSEVDAYRQCPFKHYLAYLERWSRDPEPTSALGKGTSWHIVLETHYRVLANNESAPEQVAARLAMAAVTDVIETFESEEIRALMWWMYLGYIEVYEIDRQWQIKATENTILIPLSWSDGTPSIFQLKVKIDLVFIDVKGRWWILDHKSCGQMPKDESDYAFEEQFKFYAFVLRRMGYPVTGCIHSAALTKMNKGDLIKPGDPGYKSTMKAQPLDNRFRRTLISHTEKELDMVNDELLKTATLMYSDANLHERHPNSDTCKWRCSYTEACLFGRRQGSNVKTLHMLQDTGFSQDFARH